MLIWTCRDLSVLQVLISLHSFLILKFCVWYVSVLACVGVRGWCWCFSYVFCWGGRESSSLHWTWLPPFWVEQLAWEPLGSTCLYLSTDVCHHTTRLWHGCWGSELRSSHLHNANLLPREIPASSSHFNLNAERRGKERDPAHHSRTKTSFTKSAWMDTIMTYCMRLWGLHPLFYCICGWFCNFRMLSADPQPLLPPVTNYSPGSQRFCCISLYSTASNSVT